jgi:hypothetical protein
MAEGPVEPRLVLNSLLCFVFNKYKKFDINRIMKSMLDKYTSGEIVCAKRQLLDDISTIQLEKPFSHYHDRRGDNKPENNVKDILDAVQELDERKSINALPRYVSDNPDSFPIIALENGDMSFLLGKIDRMEGVIKGLQAAVHSLSAAMRPAIDSLSHTQHSVQPVGLPPVPSIGPPGLNRPLAPKTPQPPAKPPHRENPPTQKPIVVYVRQRRETYVNARHGQVTLTVLTTTRRRLGRRETTTATSWSSPGRNTGIAASITTVNNACNPPLLPPPPPTTHSLSALPMLLQLAAASQSAVSQQAATAVNRWGKTRHRHSHQLFAMAVSAALAAGNKTRVRRCWSVGSRRRRAMATTTTTRQRPERLRPSTASTM